MNRSFLFSGGRFFVQRLIPLALLLAAAQVHSNDGLAGDWPQLGGSSARNNVSAARGLPAEWNVGQFDHKTGQWLGQAARNIKWVAKLGTESYGTPVVAGDKVFCTTNNGAGHLARFPATVDLGCLLAFRRSDGALLWQHSARKLDDDELDYPKQGMVSTPLVEGDRLWVVTNRAEVVCLDTEGFLEGENDGPYTSEEVQAVEESDIVWRFDMREQLGVVPHEMASCSPTAVGDLLFVCTSNGVSDRQEDIPAPQAPSFIALEKRTGQLVWADNSPNGNILHGQWASPAAAVIEGVSQVLFPGGDGWLYSFRADRGEGGRPVLLWKFDCNPKAAVWRPGQGDRNNLIATPVVALGRVYIATGREPQQGEGQADLWCIDPTGRGDVSAELVVDRQGQPVPPRRFRAVDPERGERVIAHPNSAAVWHYAGADVDGDEQLAFHETFHRTMGMVAVANDLLIVGDYSGLVHCLDARTGRPHWTYDMMATIWASPLVADGKVFVGNEDGHVLVFALSPKLERLAENDMGNCVFSTPVAVGDTLYIATRSHLVAIAAQ